jgi:hypothetical protein
VGQFVSACQDVIKDPMFLTDGVFDQPKYITYFDTVWSQDPSNAALDAKIWQCTLCFVEDPFNTGIFDPVSLSLKPQWAMPRTDPAMC